MMNNLEKAIDLLNQYPTSFAQTKEYKAIKHTFLPYRWAKTPEEAFYIAKHKLVEKPKCFYCGSDVKFIRFSYGYQKFCSCSCRAKYNECYKFGLSEKAIAAKKETKAKKTKEQKDKEALSRAKTLELKMGPEPYKQIGKMAAHTAIVKYCNKHGLDINKVYAIKEYNTAKQLINKYYLAKNIARNYLGNEDHTNLVTKLLNRSGYAWNTRLGRGVSDQEATLENFLNTLGYSFYRNVKGVLPNKKYELDFFYKDKNLAIEYCGHYWHNYEYQGKNKHQQKMQMCNDLGIRLITIFENDWLLRRNIVKSRVKHALGMSKTIYARKCSVKEISKQDANTFNELYHLQGKCSSLRERKDYGLFLGEELVAVATIAKPRYSKNYDWELIRYTTNISIVGGLSKIISFFNKKYYGTLVSYCDLRWGTGYLYENSSFTLEKISAPNYFYFKTTNSTHLYSRTKFMKHIIVKKLGGDPNLTEYDNMRKMGYRKIYDCGNQVWVLDLKKPSGLTGEW